MPDSPPSTQPLAPEAKSRWSLSRSWALELLTVTGLSAFALALPLLNSLSTRQLDGLTQALLIAVVALPLLLLHSITEICLLPFSKRSPKAWLLLRLLGSTLIWAFFLLDTKLYQYFGRHLLGLLVYLRQPDGHVAGGDTATTLVAIAQGLALSFCFAGLPLVLSAAVAKLPSSAQLGFGWRRIAESKVVLNLARGGLMLALLVLLLSPWLLPNFLRPTENYRLQAELPFAYLRLAKPDATQGSLEGRLSAAYAAAFARLHKAPLPFAEATAGVKLQEEELPGIHLIVMESLRAEMLSPASMPRLFAWSQKGAHFLNHSANSNHSESGVFSLMMGRSALVYDATLDQMQMPRICQLYRAMGRKCGYFSGHPRVWLRREEFLNPQVIDLFSHNDQGSWNDWDRNALKRAEKETSHGNFLLTFLMSSHFEYRYPQAYRIAQPDDPPQVSFMPGMAKRDEFESARNRYHNVVRYLDDLIADSIEATDLEKNIVIVTGDHGEETGEFGRFGHGYNFSEPLTHVPFFMVGNGIEQGSFQHRSVHEDLFPWLLERVAPSLTLARGGLFDTTPRKTQLMAYSQIGLPRIDALLLVTTAAGQAPLRVSLRLEKDKPEVRVLEYQDAEGRPIEFTPTPAEEDAIATAFVHELANAGAPFP